MSSVGVCSPWVPASENAVAPNAVPRVRPFRPSATAWGRAQTEGGVSQAGSGGGAGFPPGVSPAAPPSAQSPFLSFPCSAPPAKPPGSQASKVVCPRVGHADCVSQKRVWRAGQRREGFRAAPRSRQAGRGDGRGWGLRVPPSAPPVLSGRRQGDVKGFGGVGCLEVGVGQGRWPRGSASLRSSLPLGWAVRRGRCGGRSCLPEA